MRVFFTNLGCKLNQAEVDALARQFRTGGHAVVGSFEEADLHVVNSCTVTHLAGRDSRKAARRGARERHRPRTVLTGCHATAHPEEAAGLGVDLIVPNRDKDRLVELVARAFPDPGGADASGAPGCEAENEEMPGRPRVDSAPLSEARGEAGTADAPAPCAPFELGTARALIKIEDGCDMRCAFCIIPSTRGRQRSRPIGEVVDEVQALEAAGHREIVVTGVQISAYRDGAARLPQLVDAALAATTKCRFRLTSIAPWDLEPALLDRLDHPRLCRHVHLSLQSGDDRTLRRMRRPYTRERFASLVETLRRHVPGIAITTDVIAGFPGETAGEFASSLAFIEEIGFARVHAFTYSPRIDTEAASLAGQVAPQVKRDRMRRLLEVAAAAEDQYRRRYVGTAARVLWERRRAGVWTGTTDNYLRVFAACDGELRGRLTGARLTGVVPRGLAATVEP